MEQEKRKTVYSALKPTGKLTIGNYIGAIKNMVALQDEYDCFYAVADMHSITVDIEPAALRKNALDMFALLIAFGVSPEKSVLYVQSHVPEHAELTWVLNCYTMMGEAKRMIQFKEKSAKAPQNVNVGLFDYPVLMAADILLYQADLVPIGKDQLQHLEIAKVIAQRFNNKYSPTFTIPDSIIPKTGAKVFSLLDPTAKMGKTDDNENGVVYVLDDRDAIMRKFRRAVTDSGDEIIARADKPGISNLLTIYSAFSGKTVKEAEKEFKGSNYAQFKTAVGETVADALGKIRGEYDKIVSDKGELERLMRSGAEKAHFAARKTLTKVYKKVGFLPR